MSERPPMHGPIMERLAARSPAFRVAAEAYEIFVSPLGLRDTEEALWTLLVREARKADNSNLDQIVIQHDAKNEPT